MLHVISHLANTVLKIHHNILLKNSSRHKIKSNFIFEQSSPLTTALNCFTGFHFHLTILCWWKKLYFGPHPWAARPLELHLNEMITTTGRMWFDWRLLRVKSFYKQTWCLTDCWGADENDDENLNSLCVQLTSIFALIVPNKILHKVPAKLSRFKLERLFQRPAFILLVRQMCLHDCPCWGCGTLKNWIQCTELHFRALFSCASDTGGNRCRTGC